MMRYRLPAAEYDRLTRAPGLSPDARLHAITGLDREGLLRAACHDFHDVAQATLDGPEDAEYLDFTLRYEGPGYSDHYTLDFMSRTLGEGITEGGMESRLRDRGTGRRMFAGRALTALVTGMRHFHFSAAGMMGAAVWPRAGGRLMPDGTAHPRPALKARAALLAPYMRRKEHDALLRLCALPDADAWWRIATLDRALHIPAHVFDAAQNATHSDFTLADYREAGFFADGLRLGDYMLSGLRVPALLRLENPDDMARMEAYCRVPVRDIAAQITGLAAFSPPTQSAARSSNPASRTAPRP